MVPKSGPRSGFSAWKIPRNFEFPRSGVKDIWMKKPASRVARAVVAMCSFRAERSAIMRAKRVARQEGLKEARATGRGHGLKLGWIDGAPR
jgi:hypothetical protein